MTDTERLNWIIERILTAEPHEAIYAMDVMGITYDDLEGEADVTLGDLFRQAIDRNIANDA